jgi:hypothetical protein
VKILLPLNKRDDIAAEIRSNLLSLMEDEEALLGRSLDTAEFGAILQRHGNPILVAGRYRDAPARRLIGPALFPLYWFTLRAVVLLVIAINIIVAAFLHAKSPSLATTLLHMGSNIWLGAIAAVGWITISFAVLEYFQLDVKFLRFWNPQSLPAIPRPPARVSARVQIIAGMVVLPLWALALYSPRTMLLGGATVFDLSPAWYAMRVPLLLLAAFGIVRACLKLDRFASAEWVPLVRIVLNLAGVAFLILLLQAGDLLVPGTHWDPSRYGDALTIVNRVIAGSLVLACVLSALMCLHELRLYMRGRRNSNLLAV